MKKIQTSSSYLPKSLPKFQDGGKTIQGGMLPEAVVTRKMPFWMELKKFYEKREPISKFAEKYLPKWGRTSGDLSSVSTQNAYNKRINDLVARDILNERTSTIPKTREDRLKLYDGFSDKERDLVENSKYASEFKPLSRTKAVVDMESAQKEHGISAFTNADKLAETSSSIGERFRLFPNEDSIIDDLNPAVYIGRMASQLGSVPKNIKDGNYGRAAFGLLEPVGTGALAGIGLKAGWQGTKQFANRIVNPIADISPIDFGAVGDAVKAGRATFSATKDLPMGKRLKNATMSGIMDVGQKPGREVTSMSIFDTTPMGFRKKIDDVISKAKPGTVVHGGDMSLDSYPAYLKELNRVSKESKDFGVIRTGETKNLNDHGFKSPYIKQSLPEEVRKGMSNRQESFNTLSKEVSGNPYMTPDEKVHQLNSEDPMRDMSSIGGRGSLILDNGTRWDPRNLEFRTNLANRINKKYLEPLNQTTNLNIPNIAPNTTLKGLSSTRPLAVPEVIGYKKGTISDYGSRFLKRNTGAKQTKLKELIGKKKNNSNQSTTTHYLEDYD